MMSYERMASVGLVGASQVDLATAVGRITAVPRESGCRTRQRRPGEETAGRPKVRLSVAPKRGLPYKLSYGREASLELHRNNSKLSAVSDLTDCLLLCFLAATIALWHEKAHRAVLSYEFVWDDIAGIGSMQMALSLIIIIS